MSELSNKYHEIMEEIDNEITDEKQLKFVKSKVSELSMIFMDLIDQMTEIVNEKVESIEKNQKNMDTRLNKIQKVIDGIEKDIYDDDFEVEISCPYCNNEFVAEINSDDENEIECPECHNIIELES